MSSTVHLYLIQPDRNCYRYYELSLQPGLFQEWSLIRSWGQVGSKGCGKTVWFSSREQAEQLYERKRREKLRRGYLPALLPMSPHDHMQALGKPELKRTARNASRGPAHQVSGDQQELFKR